MNYADQESVAAVLERAQIAYQANEFSKCESLCRALLETDPECIPGLLLIGFCCARTRRRDEAIRCFESALLLDSDLVEAHIALSTLYISAGSITEGKLHGLRVLELDPTDVAPALGLAKMLADRKALNEAAEVWQILVSKNPGSLSYLRSLATTQGLAKHRKEAVDSWETVVRRSPQSTPDLIELGRAYLADSQALKAIEVSEKVLNMDRKNVDAHMLAAMALSEAGQSHLAEDHLNRVLAVQPDNPIAIASLGLAMQEQGRFEDARVALKRSIELWPSNGLAHYALIRSQKLVDSERGILDAMQSELARPGVDPLHAAYFRYALGKGFEDLAEYESAFNNYREANRVAYAYWLAHRPWDRERYRFNFDRTIEVFDKARISSLQAEKPVSSRPLFVVGMIRSGTTLVEQILSSHPDIVAAGEQTFWHEHAGRIFDPVSGTVEREEAAKVVAEYLFLLSQFSVTSARVTDKLPHNYALMGLIKAAIPEAKFVHIQRNPMDNCLSIFTTAYQRPPAFTLDIGNIVFAYQQYQRLMNHWRSQFTSDDLFEIQYENLISDRNTITRDLIAFTGLEWSDECLSHEKNSRSVHTPSTWQVRQPIYSSSVERWRRFEPWLEEFSDLKR